LLKTFKALSKTGDISQGGTTKPWIVSVEIDSEIKEYVVKLFSKKDDKQYQPTNKEFYSCGLAEEFDLSVPPYALIHFDRDFIESLNDSDQERIEEIGRQYFYGCELISSNMDYSDALTDKHLKSHDIENIFAFDVLIRNVDRREHKPNIFFKGDMYYLIDHEQALDIKKNFTYYYHSSNRWSFIYQNKAKGRHLFYKRLHNNKSKISFETFAHYLNIINLNKLHEISVSLKKHGFDVTDYELIRYYLKDVKLNQSKFITLLHEIIQK